MASWNFWNSGSKTNPNQQEAYLYELINEKSRYTQVSRFLSTMTPTGLLKLPTEKNSASRLDINDFLMQKKYIAQSNKIARVVADTVEEAQDKTNALGIVGKEGSAILATIQNEVSSRILKLYFDSYMAPKCSDMEYRLGNVKGIYTSGDGIGDKTGLLTSNGEMYTRSNLYYPFNAKIVSNAGILNQTEYYASLFFPPYKIGQYSNIGSKTNFMKNQHDKTFDQDRFALKKRGFTYREPGFKVINDQIMFLQWLAEKCTGIVSTYLTEWDLSLYMQEHLITTLENNLSMKLYLNYRIKMDNPLATQADYYNNDKGLCFGVVNSAVSKIEFDCQKSWRPNDYPLSTFWTPYQLNVDYVINTYKCTDPDTKVVKYIPYSSFYDVALNNCEKFNWTGAQLKDIIRQQDYQRMAMSLWPNTYMYYFQSLYYTDDDALASPEIWITEWLNKVAGANPGYSKQNQRSIWYFLNKTREECISNEGYNGTMSSAGGASAAAKSVQRLIKRSTTGDSGANINVADGRSETNNLNQQQSNIVGKNSLAAAILSDENPDASTMSKMVGVNRTSPVLYGGPHGASFSPLTAQSFFELNNKFLRNCPRISPNTAGNFTSLTSGNLYDGLNKYYRNPYNTNDSMSPSKAMSFLNLGLTKSVTDYMYAERQVCVRIQNQIRPAWEWRSRTYKVLWWKVTIKWKVYTYHSYFQTTASNGFPIRYLTGPSFQWIVQWQPWSMWYWNISSSRDKYWNIYNSYWSSLTYTRGPYYRNKQWGFDTYYGAQFRYGTYTVRTIVPYQKFNCHDMPDARWQIVQHRFQQFNMPNYFQRNRLWDWFVYKWPNVVGSRQRQSYELLRQNTVFILRFPGNPTLESQVIDNMIGSSNNEKLIFLEGNINGRYSTGPASIFRANCRVQYYETFYYRFYIKKHDCHWDWTYIYYYRRMPYIVVDLQRGVDFYADAVNVVPYTNRWQGNADRQIQFNQPGYTWHTTDILAKFRSMYYDRFQYCNGSYSTATWGIQGIGILSQIQGMKPNVSDYPPIVNYSQYIKLNNNSYTKPIKDISRQTHFMLYKREVKQWFPDGSYQYVPGGMPVYASIEMDRGLKNALANLFTRLTFFREDYGWDYDFLVTLDTPFRTLLNMCLYQVDFITQAKKIMLDNIDWNIMKNMLLTCVDKCVTKPAGLTEAGKVAVDRVHILYDYFIEKAVNFWTNSTTKKTLQDAWNSRINSFNYAIRILSPIANKYAKDCSMQEITNYYQAVASLEYSLRTNQEIDKYVFAYLNMLYYYRLFFIGKRFNKEDGTMWVMRALESILEFSAPAVSNNNSPPNPEDLSKEEQQYDVVFYELQNTTSMKQQAVINNKALDVDRIKICYVKIEWSTEDDYNKWIAYKNDPLHNSKVDEVVKVYKPTENGKIEKYAWKPLDDTYTLISKEMTTNDNNIKFNTENPTEKQKEVRTDIDKSTWYIKWGDEPDKTPIRWDILHSLNTNAILEYSLNNLSPDELLCLVSETADYWTVNVPQKLWPRASGFITKNQLKHYRTTTTATFDNDAEASILGAFAYTMWPIVEEQESPVPGITTEDIINQYV